MLNSQRRILKIGDTILKCHIHIKVLELEIREETLFGGKLVISCEFDSEGQKMSAPHLSLGRRLQQDLLETLMCVPCNLMGKWTGV